MLVLALRTDNPTAELHLLQDGKQIAVFTWQAHRLLAETLHTQVSALLDQAQCELKNLNGIVAFQGPGSFTGLRIGLAVANALAYSLAVPIVAATGDDWITRGVALLAAGQDDVIALPEYGAPVHITAPRK